MCRGGTSTVQGGAICADGGPYVFGGSVTLKIYDSKFVSNTAYYVSEVLSIYFLTKEKARDISCM